MASAPARSSSLTVRRHVERVAEAGVGIDHDRARKHVADRGDVVAELRQRHQAVVGNAEIGVGDAGAGDIGGREAEVGHHPGGQRIRHAGQHDGRAGLQQFAEFEAGGTGGHRIALLITCCIPAVAAVRIDNE